MSRKPRPPRRTADWPRWRLQILRVRIAFGTIGAPTLLRSPLSGDALAASFSSCFPRSQYLGRWQVIRLSVRQGALPLASRGCTAQADGSREAAAAHSRALVNHVRTQSVQRLRSWQSRSRGRRWCEVCTVGQIISPTRDCRPNLRFLTRYSADPGLGSTDSDRLSASSSRFRPQRRGL